MRHVGLAGSGSSPDRESATPRQADFQVGKSAREHQAWHHTSKQELISSGNNSPRSFLRGRTPPCSKAPRMSQFSVSAASPAPVASSSSSPSANKRRSCVVCRSRKVRCDKQSPCSNCRRANIECVVPSNDRPPRWAQRLERLTNAPTISHRAVPPPATAGSRAAKPATEQVIERLRNLEGLVKELSGQLEQANAAASSTTGGSSRGNSPAHGRAATTNTSGVQENLGRLVLQDTDRPHYISSGFWSRVSDEVRCFHPAQSSSYMWLTSIARWFGYGH